MQTHSELYEITQALHHYFTQQEEYKIGKIDSEEGNDLPHNDCGVPYNYCEFTVEPAYSYGSYDIEVNNTYILIRHLRTQCVYKTTHLTLDPINLLKAIDRHVSECEQEDKEYNQAYLECNGEDDGYK